MRFVAGRGAVAELLAGAPWRSCWPGAMRQSAIGKMLLTGAAAELLAGGGAAVAKMLLAGGAGEEYQWQGNASGKGTPQQTGTGTPRETSKGTPATQKSQLRQTELALLKPLVVSKRNNL